MVVIHQGDQYLIPIQVFSGEEEMTPDTLDDLTVKIAGVVKSYSANEMEYDAVLGCWLYPLDSYQSRSIKRNRTDAQIAVRIGDSCFYSAVQKVASSYSIIEEWEVQDGDT